MKYYHLLFFVLFATFSSCIEDYKFSMDDPDPVLVVEGFVSDVSYNDMLPMPQYPRYFEVKLRESGIVSNVRDEVVTGAEIEIINDLNESWEYTESEEGRYTLYFENFKAQAGRTYRLVITLSNNEVYESNIQSLPATSIEGTTSIEEVEELDFVQVAGEFKIRPVKGVRLNIDMPAADNGEVQYRKWDFFTTYKFLARLNRDANDPTQACWITSIYQNDEVVVTKMNNGGKEKLFFLPMTESKIHDGYSTSIRQQTLNQDHYQFWVDLKKQKEQSDLFSAPPYNLPTNLSAQNEENQVLGYFGVVSEKYYRWDFRKDEVSYNLPYPESIRNGCNVPRPPISCFDCRFAPMGPEDINNTDRPWWWYLE